MSLTTGCFRGSVLCNGRAQEREVVRWFFGWFGQWVAGWALDAGAAGAPTPVGECGAGAERVSGRVGAGAVTSVWEAGMPVRGRGPARALPVSLGAAVVGRAPVDVCAGSAGRGGDRAGDDEREDPGCSGRDLRDQPGVTHPPATGVGADAGDGGGRGTGCPGGKHARGRCPRRPPGAEGRRSGARGIGARAVPGGGGAGNAGRVSAGIGHVGGRS
jgi:hypothetical protein